MQINILAFGQVAGITGNQFQITAAVSDTNGLEAALQQQYPALSHMKYAIAVDRKLVKENTPLTSNVVVALLPPFSGG